MSYLARIEMNRQAIIELVVNRRAANPRLFGSALDQSESTDSEIDILVDAMPGATLFDRAPTRTVEGSLHADLRQARR